MPVMPPLRRSPWLAGALLLLLAAALVAPVAVVFGLRHWSLYAGLLAILVLCFGVVERLWQTRAWMGSRLFARRHLRLVPDGKRKGNGGDADAKDPEALDSDEPRWLM